MMDAGSGPALVVNPVVVDFTACPSSVQGASVGRATVALTNTSADPVAFTVEAPSDAAFSIEPNDAGVIAPRATHVVVVRFAPTALGVRSSTLRIREDRGSYVVTLRGSAVSRPAAPAIGFRLPSTTGQLACLDAAAPLSDCTVSFTDLPFGASEDRTLTLVNQGCQPLRVTELRLAPAVVGDPFDFELISPVPPTPAAPLVLDVATRTDALPVVVRFRPRDDGSGIVARDALLSALSNDPLHGAPTGQPAVVVLQAAALRSALAISPSGCDFSQASDRCGLPTRTADRASFTLANDGNAPIRITSINVMPGTDAVGRFVIGQNPTGTLIAPGGTTTLTVQHVPQALFVSATIVVSAEFASQPGVSAGVRALTVMGGTKPCLSTTPRDTIAFTGPAASTRTLTIQNGAACGVLRVDGVGLTTISSVFSLDPLPFDAGVLVQAGGSLSATVRYVGPGVQLNAVTIRSNDPSFGPDGKQVLVTATP